MIFPYKISEEQKTIIEELDQGRSILLSSYVGSGKTAPVLFYALSKFPEKNIVIATFKHTHYLSFIKELENISNASNVSLNYAGIFGKEYMINIDFNYHKNYFNPFEFNYYRPALKIIKYSKVKMIGIKHLLDENLFSKVNQRFNIDFRNSVLILDEAHNLFNEIVQNPKIVFLIRYLKRIFFKSVFMSGTFIPKQFFRWAISPDKIIDIQDKRRIKIFVDSKLDMSFSERSKNIDYIKSLLKSLSNKGKVVAFFQNKEFAKKFSDLFKENIDVQVFRGKYNESISLENKVLVAVGLPFPHKSIIERLKLISFISSISIEDLLYGATASLLLQMIGRANRSPKSSSSVYVLDKRALYPQFLKFLPQTYEIERF
ncbi:MAG: hypothetical protein OH318_00395 [Candidatus Parvarchaeota archaeon]|nr:hypothetical protein [Candidatus Rehaiarchaeum fermentans]